MEKPHITPGLAARLSVVHERFPGVFHILLDDGNYGRDHALFCLSCAVETKDDEAIDVAVLLSRMSPTQHKKLAAMVHGTWWQPAVYRMRCAIRGAGLTVATVEERY